MTTNQAIKGLMTLLMGFVLGACSYSSKVPIRVATDDVETINTSLETLAQYVAGAVTDVKVREQIQQGVAARFDGDSNVLYKTLMSEQVQNPLRQALVKTYLQSEFSSQSETQGTAAIAALANNIPNLQIAVPAHFDTWNAGQYTPLVGYVPAGVDDNALTSIKAFDGEGNVHLLDAHTPPEQPVILLSQNERTDETGTLRSEYLIQKETSAGLNATATTCQHVYVWGVRLVHDYEPWYMGDPEIVLLAYSWTPGLYYHAGFAEVNKENQVYYFNRYLGCTSSHMTFSWYEDDGAWSDRDRYGDVTVYDIYIDGTTTWKSAGSYHLDFATN
jgi:Protein of unknown function (DUF3103)